MRVSLVFLLVTLLVALVLAQDSSEESPIPKKTLRKYRIRRPVTLDENGNPRPTGTTTRLRRIRVKQRPTEASPTPTAAPIVLEEQYVTVDPESARQVFYEEQPQIVEPARNVAQYRTATSAATRSTLLANVHLKSRVRGDEEEKKNVGTTRNYSQINEDGSFTFGYEAQDGSFKEETRGTDCVVRGKYGYVDPDGVRREFTYVSGNPCDPNEVKEENAQDDEADDRAAPPTRPLLRRVRPEITQNLLQTAEEKLTEDQLPALFRVSNRQRRPNNQNNIQPTTFRPRIRIQTTPTPSDEPAVLQPFIYSTRPRQSRPIQEIDNNLPQGRSLFNFQAEVQRIQQQQQQQPEAQAQVQVQYTPHSFPSRQVFGQNFQHQRQRQQQRPQEELKANQATATIADEQSQQQQQQSNERQTNFGNYRTELVFDPATNQYTSVLVQDIPKTNEEFTLTQRLRAFVEPQNPNQFQVHNPYGSTVQYFGNHPQLLEQQQQQQQQHQQQQQQIQQQQIQQQQQQIQQQQAQQQHFLPQQGGSLPVRSLQFQNQIPQHHHLHQQSSIPQLHADAQQIHSSPVSSAARNHHICREQQEQEQEQQSGEDLDIIDAT